MKLHTLRFVLIPVCGLASTACSYAHVDSGEVAVVRTPDGVDPHVYETGDWHIGIYDTATNYNIRSQEREEQLDVLASNGLRIVLDTSIRYHIVPNEAVALDRELGANYYSILIGPTLRSQARRVVGRYQPEQIYSTERELIERQMREGIEGAIKGRHIVLEAVLIRNVQLPDSIQGAINNKLEAEQQALKMKYVLDQARQKADEQLMEAKAAAERKKIEAESEAAAEKIAADSAAERTQIQAEANAKNKKLEGEALADYEKNVTRNLSQIYVKWRQVEATRALGESPNSKLIFFGGGNRAPEPLLDLRGSTSESPYP